MGIGTKEQDHCETKIITGLLAMINMDKYNIVLNNKGLLVRSNTFRDKVHHHLHYITMIGQDCLGLLRAWKIINIFQQSFLANNAHITRTKIE